MNNPRIYIFMGDIDPFSFTQQDANQYTESHKKDTRLIVVNEKDNWIPVGYTGMFIRKRHRVGIFRIAIANEKYLKQGHASRATKLMIFWAFKECDLQTIHLSVSEKNKHAISLYKTVGFRECGKYFGSRYEFGQRVSEILMEYTVDMFNDYVNVKGERSLINYNYATI